MAAGLRADALDLLTKIHPLQRGTMPTSTIKGARSRKRIVRETYGETKSGTVRLSLRLDAHAKMLIERAAVITGQTLTDFAVSNLSHSAMAIIERHDRLVLTDRDRDRFLKALDRS
jgi:uncharacterized protein (DUF1778 family)